MLAEGKITPADDETENRMYDLLCDHAAANGMEHYEVSNFAKPGFRSRHNSAYWTRTPYIGLGAGAHSYDGHRQRRANICDLEQYIRTPGTHTCEQLTDTNLYNERVMLALRTAEGIAAEEINPACSPALDNYLSRGLLRQSGGRIAATRQGLHILNRIIEDLMI
jgi:oxygen-independent coproporphyrinogen-3 oxidase